MPTYVYRIVGRGDTFEVVQSIHDAPLTLHPQTGETVERVICPPTIGKGAVTASELRGAGLTQYKKTADGTYEKQT